ncbi:MAG: hypothetical protein VKI42_02695 [Synechococcaceae cyanobacterium]|nr:hypothetical protein [Synechococcaceae cyanobacterium]
MGGDGTEAFASSTLQQIQDQRDGELTAELAPADASSSPADSEVSIPLAVSPTAVLEDGGTNLVSTFPRTGDSSKALTVNYSVAGTAANWGDSTGIGFGATTAVINTVEVGLPSGTIISEDGSQSLHVVFSRQGDTSNPLTVDFTVAGSAEFGLDYDQRGASSFNVRSGSVTFAAGAAIATVSLDALSDAISDGNESVVLSLTEETDFAIGANRSVNGTILDNDGPPGSVTTSPIRPSTPGRTASEFDNTAAFAALKADGSVVTWGSSAYGGDSRGVADQLRNPGVTQIFSTGSAFAALKADGSVVTWGNPDGGGRGRGMSSDVVARLRSGVTHIFSNIGAFAALKADGSVVTWGGVGGDSRAVSTKLASGVTQIFSTANAFAALKADGSVVT